MEKSFYTKYLTGVDHNNWYRRSKWGCRAQPGWLRVFISIITKGRTIYVMSCY